MISLKYFSQQPNVGDQFSLFLAKKIFSLDVAGCSEGKLDFPNVILLGSIIHWCDQFSHICGGGLISSQVKLTALPEKVYCVRGPLTAYFLRRQGVEVPECFADPGILVSQYFPALTTELKYSVGIVPHYVDKGCRRLADWEAQGALVIDPLLPIDIFLSQLNKCDVILSSSLHGLIFAHAFNKPALWVELSSNVLGDGFKFYDYYLSMNISPEKVVRCSLIDEGRGTELSLVALANLASYGNHSELHVSLGGALEKLCSTFNRR